MITLGGETFRTADRAMTALRTELTAVLPAGTGIFAVVGQRTMLEAMLFDAIERHPERDLKVGSGIARFLVRRNVKNPRAAEVWLERTDGSRIDFSWRKCATGKATSSAANLRSAMREAVRSQVAAFRMHESAFLCGLCRREMGADPGHVDHIIPFELLALEFLADGSRTPPTQFDDGDACQAIFRRADEVFEAAWVAFHARRAQLRLVHARCNLSRSRSEVAP